MLDAMDTSSSMSSVKTTRRSFDVFSGACIASAMAVSLTVATTNLVESRLKCEQNGS